MKIRQRHTAGEQSRVHRAALRTHLGHFVGVLKQIASLTETRERSFHLYKDVMARPWWVWAFQTKQLQLDAGSAWTPVEVTAFNDICWVTGPAQKDFSAASGMRLGYTHTITPSRNADREAQQKSNLLTQSKSQNYVVQIEISKWCPLLKVMPILPADTCSPEE